MKNLKIVKFALLIAACAGAAGCATGKAAREQPATVEGSAVQASAKKAKPVKASRLGVNGSLASINEQLEEIGSGLASLKEQLAAVDRNIASLSGQMLNTDSNLVLFLDPDTTGPNGPRTVAAICMSDAELLRWVESDAFFGVALNRTNKKPETLVRNLKEHPGNYTGYTGFYGKVYEIRVIDLDGNLEFGENKSRGVVMGRAEGASF